MYHSQAGLQTPSAFIQHKHLKFKRGENSRITTDKVQATKTFEHCARMAAHLHGGNSYVKGNRVESLYRHVLSLAIPGGSEDVMIDYAARLMLKGRLWAGMASMNIQEVFFPLWTVACFIEHLGNTHMLSRLLLR